ncbi:MAG TPA: ATP-dependent RecD-like DNA helicase [Kofleriaceae bacterium]|nr:ATP-dependent RecD-like DNA helicase [Kofleriaceae bacterium]
MPAPPPDARATAPDAGPAAEVTLDGTIERFVFRNEESAFTVARLSAADHTMVTIVGELVGISEGIPLRLRGRWVDDRKFGRQFRVATYQLRSPETLVGIERFLGSGIIPGIGPELARRLVSHFKMDTLEVIDRTPQRLVEVAGIGAARAAKLAAAFAAQRHVQDVMVFLRGHGVSAAFAARIVKKYGKNAINVVRANPYRLAHEIWGIGFRTADAIAGQLGIARDAPERLEAGLLHALETSAEDGHMHLPDDELIGAAAELLEVAADRLAPRLAALEGSRLIVRETLGHRGACSMLPWAHDAEATAAALLAQLIRTPARGLALDIHAAIHAFEAVTGVQLAAQQRRAVEAALVDKCTVITGGPGVGKTTIVKAIVHLAKLVHRRVALAAPTGRAAKRLGEATVMEAMTLHRLLEFQPHEGGFQRGPDNPLDADLLVVDEASMVDAQLFNAVVGALRPGAQLVLVGDIDQLPSVGAGAVLSDVIASDAATVIRLTEIFRQAAASQIVVSAHAINAGELPVLDPPAAAAPGSPPPSDFYFIARDDPEAARATIVELVAERIPARFGFDPIADIQVLAPMHRGELGTSALNRALQDRLNPGGDPGAGTAGPELARGERVFRSGDKVMQLRNDYDKSVFNGDIGVIAAIDGEAGVISVEFDGRLASYERSELDQLAHAYAVSVHKSQGSEYAAVVIPLVTQHYMMLQRSLLYTAVTRGKRLVVIVGSKRAVALAVRNADARRRYTWLAERVRAQMTA